MMLCINFELDKFLSMVFDTFETLSELKIMFAKGFLYFILMERKKEKLRFENKYEKKKKKKKKEQQ